MSDMTHKIRAENVIRLAEKAKHKGMTYTSFADKAGIDPAYLYHIRTGRRLVGETLARRIEKRLELPMHSLDTKDSTGSSKTVSTDIDPGQFAKLLRDVECAMKRLAIEWNDADTLGLVFDLYQIMKETGESPDIQGVLRVMALQHKTG